MVWPKPSKPLKQKLLVGVRITDLKFIRLIGYHYRFAVGNRPSCLNHTVYVNIVISTHIVILTIYN